MQPEGDGHGGMATPGQVGDTAGRGQGLADERLGLGLQWRQAGRVRAFGEVGGDQAAIAVAQAGETGQGRLGQVLVTGQPVVVRPGLARGQGREPEIEVPVEPGLRKTVNEGRQEEGTIIPPGQGHLVADPGDAGQQAASGAVPVLIGGLDLQAGVAPQGAKEDAN